MSCSTRFSPTQTRRATVPRPPSSFELSIYKLYDVLCLCLGKFPPQAIQITQWQTGIWQRSATQAEPPRTSSGMVRDVEFQGRLGHV